MALEQDNLVEKDSGERRNTVGAFRASGLADQFFQPKSTLPPLAAEPQRNPLVGNYLDRALRGLQSFAAPTPAPYGPPAPIITASNSDSDERDRNFALYGTNFPTPAQVAAVKAREEEDKQGRRSSPVGERRLAEQLRPSSVSYNPSSTI